MNKQALSDWIKQESQNLGFMITGISKAVFLEKEAKDLEKWLSEKSL